MTDTLDLFDPGRMARASDPATSHAAAESMRLAIGWHYRAILSVLGRHDMLAAEQIADLTDLDSVAVNRRLPELERAGLIERTALKHRNRSGRMAFKYRRMG